MLPLDENGGFEMTGTNRIARQTFGEKRFPWRESFLHFEHFL